jgi:alpha-ketoglutarate-dependent taurine dioxygenase
MERILGPEREESESYSTSAAVTMRAKIQFRHRWRPNDLLIWDHRLTMHQANADYAEAEWRLLHRIVIAGSRPY